MKEIPKSLVQRGPSVILYREDLDEMIEVLNACCSKVQISDDEFTYESLDELAGHRGNRPRSLTLRGNEPPVRVVVGNLRVLVSVGGESPGGAHAYLRITNVLARRTRKLALLFRPEAAFVVALIGMISMGLLFYKGSLAGLVGFVLMILGLIAANPANSLQGGRYSRISLRRQYEEESFWSRNKDKLLVGLISAAVAALLGGVVGYLLKG